MSTFTQYRPIRRGALYPKVTSCWACWAVPATQELSIGPNLEIRQRGLSEACNCLFFACSEHPCISPCIGFRQLAPSKPGTLSVALDFKICQLWKTSWHDAKFLPAYSPSLTTHCTELGVFG
eukprot:1154095-Pelagomonas_calceolata.AAC.1